MSQIENLKNISKHGGARKGAGRPKGKENQNTKERRIAEEEMRNRVIKSTDSLLNSQMALAKGEVNLYRVYYTGQGSKKQKHVDIVTDQETITEYLADSLNNGEDEYYYIATKSPDNRSIDSLLDRTYGKAKQSVDLTSAGEKVGLNDEQIEQLIRARAKRSNT